MTSRRSDTAAQDEAAAWVARLGSDQRTRADEDAFDAWLSDPANAAAFDDHAQLWDGVGALGADAEARTIVLGEPASRRPTVNRRTALAGVTAAAAATAAAVVLPRVDDWRGLYHTRRGQQRQVILSDGSRLMLDTDTRLRVSFSDAERRLTLERGQAHFKVAKDAARPFRVFVGDDEVRAVGTAFDVRKDGAGCKVTLEEGIVAVYRAGAPKVDGVRAPAAVLKPGQQARLAPAAPVQVASVDLTRVQAWRYGRLVFDSAPLGEAVDDINRYGGRQVVLSDPALAAIKISGVFHTTDPDAFVEAITAAFPVKLASEDSRELVLAPS